MCEVQRCYTRRADGDKYFCDFHRFRWRQFIKLQGLQEKIIPKEAERELLNIFINGEI